MLPKHRSHWCLANFDDWRDSSHLTTINHLLAMTARQQVGREASPTARIIESQSIKMRESGGMPGYDAGKKVKGRERHLLTDTLGFPIFILVHAADIQDRDGAARCCPQSHPLTVPLAASCLRRWRLCRKQELKDAIKGALAEIETSK